MIGDIELQLNECLGRTTVDAAAAGLHLIDFITGLNQNISWTLSRGRIDFRAERPFCSLYPRSNHIRCRVHDADNGRNDVKLTRVQDVTGTLQDRILNAYRCTGLRPTPASKQPRH